MFVWTVSLPKVQTVTLIAVRCKKKYRNIRYKFNVTLWIIEVLKKWTISHFFANVVSSLNSYEWVHDTVRLLLIIYLQFVLICAL